METSSTLKAVEKDAGAKTGMWLFLVTEVLLFGGLFLLYAVYRSIYANDFRNASSDLNTAIGAANTVILLTSSLTMVLSISAMQKGSRQVSRIFLLITILSGLLFLINKYYEWSFKFAHGIYPGSPVLAEHTHGEIIFYGLYYAMTGLHGLHIIAGVLLLSVMLYKIRLVSPDVARSTPHPFGNPPVVSLQLKLEPPIRYGVDRATSGETIFLYNSGLYWHLVDVIWIFLFPLFYLVR